MKKRILPLALALLLALTGLAVPAAAADSEPIRYSSHNTEPPEAGAPLAPYTLTVPFDADLLVTQVRTRHWNNGYGAAAGTISISELHIDGTEEPLGEWWATPTSANTYWTVWPEVTLFAGHTYVFRPSSIETWSHNAASRHVGMTDVWAVRQDTVNGYYRANVTVNGVPVEWTDAVPFIDGNSRIMVPLRAVADALKLSVGWNDEAREASFTNGSRAIYFPIGSNEARTGLGGYVIMDTEAIIINNRTYAPFRYLAEFFGYEVGWDGATRTGLITGEWTPTWSPLDDPA